MRSTSEKRIPVQFRFPITQSDDKSVIVHVPTSTDGKPLVMVHPDAAKDLNLSDKECDKMIDAAEDAALRSILIKK